MCLNILYLIKQIKTEDNKDRGLEERCEDADCYINRALWAVLARLINNVFRWWLLFGRAELVVMLQISLTADAHCCGDSSSSHHHSFCSSLESCNDVTTLCDSVWLGNQTTEHVFNCFHQLQLHVLSTVQTEKQLLLTWRIRFQYSASDAGTMVLQRHSLATLLLVNGSKIFW